MTAAEARALSTKILREGNVYKNIQQRISAAAEDGKSQTFFYNSIPGEVETRLKEEGFSVESANDPRDNDIVVKISW